MAENRVETFTYDQNASLNLSERVTNKLWEEYTNLVGKSRSTAQARIEGGAVQGAVQEAIQGTKEAIQGAKDANGNDSARREEQSWFDNILKMLANEHAGEPKSPSNSADKQASEIDNPKKSSEDTEAPRKPEQTEQERRNEQFITTTADYIAQTIAKDGDFHAGLRRERIEDALEGITMLGPEALKRLADQVNATLAKTNPGLKFEFTYGIETVEYLDPDRQMLMIYPPPSFTVDEPRATVSIVHENGEKEDEIHVAIHPRGKGQRMSARYRNFDLDNIALTEQEYREAAGVSPRTADQSAPERNPSLPADQKMPPRPAQEQAPAAAQEQAPAAAKSDINNIQSNPVNKMKTADRMASVVLGTF